MLFCTTQLRAVVPDAEAQRRARRLIDAAHGRRRRGAASERSPCRVPDILAIEKEAEGLLDGLLKVGTKA